MYPGSGKLTVSEVRKLGVEVAGILWINLKSNRNKKKTLRFFLFFYFTNHCLILPKKKKVKYFVIKDNYRSKP